MECTDGHYTDDDGNCYDCGLTGCAVCLFAGGNGDSSQVTDDPLDVLNTGASGGYITTQSPITCKECVDGYYMNNQDQCAECGVTNCAVCDIDGDCEECSSGYSLDDDGACTGCIDNCIDCTGDVTTCKRCADNYELVEDDGTCGEIDNDCGSYCSICGAQGICKQCMVAYYKDDSNDCVACMDNCAECTSATTCSECEQGSGYDNGACELYSDALEYCEEMIRDNVFSEGTECQCEGWECSAIVDTTTTAPLRGRQ